MKKLQDLARNIAAAEIFKTIASEQESKGLLEKVKTKSDTELNSMALVNDIPRSDWPVFRSLMRGEAHDFYDQISGFNDRLETGDIILMTGTSNQSKILANSQKLFYSEAQSSHIAIVHANFICIDAMPSSGVSNRLIFEVLSDVEDNWRVARFKNLNATHQEVMQQKCAFYIEQPYKILPSRRPAKNFSYCSELARKIYQDCNIDNTHIPNSRIIKPSDFDKIVDQGIDWVDVTDKVLPFIKFCENHSAIFKVMSKLFVDGLKLNRSRYEERRNEIRIIRAAEKKGKISSLDAEKRIREIHALEKRMHFKFWDFAHQEERV